MSGKASLQPRRTHRPPLTTADRPAIAHSKVRRAGVAPKVARSAGTPKVGRSAATPKIDRRVLHTRDALGDALVALMHEKPFDAITVQEVLERAHVGRSTFYAHYRDKNDLFLSDVEDFFELMANMLAKGGESSNRVAPVRELFAHVAEWHKFRAAMIASGKIHDAMELGHGYFARAIEKRLAGMPAARAIPPTNRAAVSHAFAGAMVSLLAWWIDHGMPASPAEMDDLYHQIVWLGLSSPARPTPQGTPGPAHR
jgi:AcrR family transcriptional regulator